MSPSFRRTALIVALIILLAPHTWAQPQGPAWRPAAVESFDVAWATIRDTFYDPDMGGLDWDAVRDELRPQVEAASTEDAARGVIRDMLGRLGRSHFALLSPEAVGGGGGDARVPVDVRITGQGAIVTRTTGNGGPDADGIHPGDIIVAIDGQAVPEPPGGPSPEETRDLRLDLWRVVDGWLRGRPASPARVRLRSTDGRERDVTVVRERPGGEIVRLGTLPPLPVRVESRTVDLAGRLSAGVIAFNVWMAPVDAPLTRAVDDMRTLDGIVLDLRGNPGGLAEMIRGVSGHFFAEPETLGRMRIRTGELEFRANPRRSTPDGRRVEPFAGPVAILVDELTASASECFAGALQALGRARVFGRPTMGQALPALTKVLPNNDTLMYVVGDFITSAGESLEGRGVVPDEVVALDPETLAAGRDAVLDAALAWLAGRPAAGQALQAPPIENIAPGLDLLLSSNDLQGSHFLPRQGAIPALN